MQILHHQKTSVKQQTFGQYVSKPFGLEKSSLFKDWRISKE